MQNKVMEYLADVEELLQEEEKKAENYSEMSNVELLTTLKNIEDYCLTTHFGNLALCGSHIAKNKKGKLVYELNDSESANLKKGLVEDVSDHLHDYNRVVETLLKPDRNLGTEDRIKVKNGVEKVQDYCLKYGFYGKCVHLSKIMKQKFRKNQVETIEKIMAGYAKRQILTGDDQLKKVKHLLKSLLFNEYGKIPFGKTKQQLLDNYDKAVVKISGKEFGLKDSKNAISTM
jgi:hypothetical protein